MNTTITSDDLIYSRCVDAHTTSAEACSACGHTFRLTEPVWIYRTAQREEREYYFCFSCRQIAELPSLPTSKPLSSIRSLLILRRGCLYDALRAYRNEHDPRMRAQRAYWAGERQFWTIRAWQYHGELMAQREGPEFPSYIGFDGREHAEY